MCWACWSRSAALSRHTCCRFQWSAVGPGPVQSVADTTVGGHLTQVRDAKAVRVHGPVTSGPSPGPRGGLAPGAEMPGGQYVNGVWVAGNLTQVDGSDGDVTVG